MFINNALPTHAQKLERWLGKDEVERISAAMKDWYGPPIRVGNTPGRVFATKGGDFVGPIRAGGFANLADYQLGRLNRAMKRAALRQRDTLNMGFSSFSDLISEATSGGKRRQFLFQKTGATGVIAATNTLWYAAGQPAAGANAAAAPGGSPWTDSDSIPFDNPAGGDTQHIATMYGAGTVAGNSLLLYDRLFSVTKTMSSSATEAVTGVPTRYQNTTSGADDSAEGNFLMIECRSALSAASHNWTVCQYTDQSGNTGNNLPSVTGNASCIANRLDQPTGTWFTPLASGDTGIQKLTQMQCSSGTITGAIDFTIGHPLLWLPCPIANQWCVTDALNTSFNLPRVFDDACLALLEVTKPATTATNYNAHVITVRG